MEKGLRQGGGIIHAWLLLCALGCIGFSLFGDRVPPQYFGKLIGILACAAVALLALLVLATGDAEGAHWIGEGTAPLPQRVRKRYAGRTAAVFLAGTAVEAAYAYYGTYIERSGLLRDSLVGAAIFCVAALAARRLCSGEEEPRKDGRVS